MRLFSFVRRINSFRSSCGGIRTIISPRQESNPHLSLRTGLLYPLSYEGCLDCSKQTLHSKKLFEFIFVEANDEILVYRDNRHTHLSALFHHLLTLLDVSCNVVVRVLHFIGIKEILRHVAEMACRR